MSGDGKKVFSVAKIFDGPHFSDLVFFDDGKHQDGKSQNVGTPPNWEKVDREEKYVDLNISLRRKEVTSELRKLADEKKGLALFYVFLMRTGDYPDDTEKQKNAYQFFVTGKLFQSVFASLDMNSGDDEAGGKLEKTLSLIAANHPFGFKVSRRMLLEKPFLEEDYEENHEENH